MQELDVKVGITGTSANVVPFAALLVQAGVSTLVHQSDPGVAENVTSRISRRMERSAQRKSGTVGDLVLVSALGDLATCDIVVEMAGEGLKVKLGLLRELGQVCPDVEAVVTVTATLSVTRLASAAAHPERVAGLHIGPAVRSPRLIEVIPGRVTTPVTIDRVVSLARRIGCEAIVVKNRPGFILGRISQVYFGEALRLLEDGTAPVETIDALARGMGFKTGPFEALDATGLDVALFASRALFESSGGDARYRPQVGLVEMVDAGLLGRKSGHGFYAHEQE